VDADELLSFLASGDVLLFVVAKYAASSKVSHPASEADLFFFVGDAEV